MSKINVWMESTPEAIKYPLGILNEAYSEALLYEGVMFVSGATIQMLECRGILKFSIFPKPQTYFSLQSYDRRSHLALVDDVGLTITINDKSYKAVRSSLTQSSGKGADKRSDLEGFIFEEIFPNKNLNVDEAYFLMPNVPLISGDNLRIGTMFIRARINLSFENIDIIVDPINEDTKHYDKIKEKGTSGITHVGKLKIKNGTVGQGRIEEIFEKLSECFSFSLGRYTYPILPIMYFEGDQIHQEFVTNKVIAPATSHIIWNDCSDTVQLEVFFNNLMNRFFEKDKKLNFNKLLHWFIESEKSELLQESKLIILVTALDYIAWFVLVVVNNQIEPSSFKKRSTSLNIREVLEFAGIDSSFNAMFVNERLINVSKKMSATDGPDLIVRVRHSIVHPNRNEEISNFVINELFITKALASLYLEYLILWYVGYSGNVVNRLKTPHYVGDYIKSPWKSFKE